MPDEPLGSPHANGNGEESKLRESIGRIVLYLMRHAPLPAIVGGVMWFRTSDAPAEGSVSSPSQKSIQAEVEAQLKPIKEDVEAIKTSVAKMQGFIDGRFARTTTSRNGGTPAEARFRDEAAAESGTRHP